MKLALLAIVGAVLVAPLAAGVHLVRSMRWLMRETRRARYFGRTLAERRALKEEIARRGVAVNRILGVLSWVRRLRMPTIRYRGVTAPAGVCPRADFEAATRYVPTAEDIFVATQMKCGTTWMQQVVYETLLRGQGDLSDEGHRHMYALSPWIESAGAVSMDDAPRIGPGNHRIVKTHLPVTLCPYSEDARYVYVTRHPVACFASCVDFMRFLGGVTAPTLPEAVDWFCGDEMWWGPWPDHVDGWWRWSQSRDNVLFVHYEEMLDDLGASVDRVAAFLGVSLTAAERAEVVRKSGYAYMKENEDHFEMAAPSFMNTAEGSYFQSGRADRDRDVGPAERERIAAYCRERLRGSAYPLARFYPDVALPEAAAAAAS